MTDRAASLGQLAVAAGILPRESWERLVAALRASVRAGQPASLGRLLVQGGLKGDALRELLARGAHLRGVCCDACGREISHAILPGRKEYPCPRCGSLLFPFAPFAADRTARGPTPARLAGREARAEDADEDGATIGFGQVLALPEPPSSLQVATPTGTVADAEDQKSTLELQGQEGSTFPYAAVLTPDGALPDEAPGGTVAFAGVFVLPGAAGRGPRSDEETIVELRRLADPAPDRAERPGAAKDRDAADDDELEPGLVFREVGPYRLIRTLGAGSVGQVFLARHAERGDQVALKVLRPEAAKDREYLRRFQREARASARVRHPNVVRTIEAGMDPARGLHYLALEYVPGRSLGEELDDEVRLPERRALEITRAVCAALGAAAAEGVIHRDVKPDNVLLGDDGSVKLTDLGLAKQLDSGTKVTETGIVVGTPVYMAPEQASGREVDVRADLYSLGLCTWQMLTGELPFCDDDASAFEIIMRHLQEELPDPRVHAPDVSPGAAQVVRGLTARRLDRRYASPAAALQDINRVLAGEQPLGATQSQAPGPRGAATPLSETVDAPGPDLARGGLRPLPPAPRSGMTRGLLLALLAAGALALVVWGALWVRHWVSLG